MKKPLWPEVLQYSGEHYEECFFVPLGGGPLCPPYRFTIAVTDAGSNVRILRLEVVLTPDAEFQKFVDRHPKWKIDPRPLLLSLLEDIFWQLRIIEVNELNPFHLESAISDQKLGTSLGIKMAVIRYVATPDSTLVNLVNYANTHIRDQLAQVYVQCPKANWTEEEASRIKSKFYNDRALAEAEWKSQQRHNLSNWRRQVDRINVFVDESGDMGFSNSEECYIYTATSVFGSVLSLLRLDLIKIVEDFWEDKKPSELHFSKIPENKRIDILERMSEVLEKYDVQVVSHVIKKRDLLKYYMRCEAENRRSEEQPIKTVMQTFLSDSANNPQRYFLSMCFEEIVRFVAIPGVLQGFSLRFVHDKKHKQWMNDAIEQGFQRATDGIDLVSEAWSGEVLSKELTLSLVHSHEESSLWISDWVGWEISRWLRGQQISEALKRVLTKIQIICFDDQGQKVRLDQLGGKIVQKYPDWPRQAVTPANS